MYVRRDVRYALRVLHFSAFHYYHFLLKGVVVWFLVRMLKVIKLMVWLRLLSILMVWLRWLKMIVNGDQYVMIIGQIKRLMWSVDN